MTPHSLTLTLGSPADLAYAQHIVTEHHYLHRPVDPRARPMVYIVRYDDIPCGLVMLGIPHATRCGGWWGYPGLVTQWQVVDLCRIWLSSALQVGGFWCEPGTVPGFVDRRGVWRPAVATWAISEVLQRLQRDRVALWPPVYLEQPYHIRLAVAYQDPKFHRGTIYRHSQALPMYVDSADRPIAGPSGKFGWAWKLPEPTWNWQELTDIRPRTMRLI